MLDWNHSPKYLTMRLYWGLGQELDLRAGKPFEEMWFQLDNTTRENKNQFVMAYFQWVVHMGYARKITVHFLPVG